MTASAEKSCNTRLLSLPSETNRLPSVQTLPSQTLYPPNPYRQVGFSSSTTSQMRRVPSCAPETRRPHGPGVSVTTEPWWLGNSLVTQSSKRDTPVPEVTSLAFV
eukprot:scaffold217119_cov32-Tisochrysis_lutea.AAC.2